MESNKPRLFDRAVFRVMVVLIIAAVVVFSASNVSAGKHPAEDAPAKHFTGYLEERIPHLMDYYEIPGVTAALVRDARVVWTDAFGYADLEEGKKMTTDSVCRVESISKAVTAWGVMKLAEEGRIDLDAPVEQYVTRWEIPESQFSTKGVTTRRLLSASAGMVLGPYGIRFSPTDPNVPTLIDRLNEYAVQFQEPGSSFFYSNTGYYVLELLIEEVSGRDFAQYMEDEILMPLGMDDADFRWRDDFEGRVPNGYDQQGNPIPPYVYPDKAAGGLFATVGDIASFISAGMTDFSDAHEEVLSATSIETIYSPVVDITGYYGIVFDSYGLGHFIESLPGGKKAVAVGGQGTGWMCHFHSVPETGDGIVVFTNSQNSWPFFAHILSGWAQWRGFPSVGMGMINTGQALIWVLIGLILAAVLWQSWRVGQDWAAGRRRFAPLAEEARALRVVEFLLFLAIAAGLVWILSLDYFFLDSTFPVASGWLWAVLTAADAVLLFTAFLPRYK